LTAAPIPAITPHPSRAGNLGGRGRIDLRALAGGDERLLRERADAERGRQRGAVRETHLLRGVVRREAVPRLAAPAGPALAADRPPVQDHEVAGRDVGDVRADRLDDAGRLVTQQERKLVVDTAVAIVHVRVADAAGLDAHQRLARPGIGQPNRLDPDWLALGETDHGAHILSHRAHSRGPTRFAASRAVAHVVDAPAPRAALIWRGIIRRAVDRDRA
jgi:hypothetical protein